MPKKKKKKGKETYKLTPNGIVTLALVDAGMADSISDARIDVFWKIFVRGMIEGGYVEEG